MFKTGDEAKVSDPHETADFCKGDIVEVVDDEKQESLGVRRISDGRMQFMDAEDLEKMSGGKGVEIYDSLGQKLKEGDKVKVLERGISCFTPGDIVEVEMVKVNPWCCRDDGLRQNIQPEKLEKVKDGGKDMKTTGLSRGNEVTFHVNGGKFTGEVTGRSGDYFINFDGCPNGVVFRELDLDPEQFCEEVCGVETHGGDWPEVETLGELETVIDCLQKEIERKEEGDMKKQEVFPVKIISAQRSSYWYSDKIGEVFNVTHHETDKYKVVPDEYRLINKVDCTSELYDRIEDIQPGDHIEILENFGHPAIKAGHILEATGDRESSGDFRMKFIRGVPEAGKEMATHPFPMTSKDQVEGRFRIISKKEETKMSAKETLINFMMKKQARLGDSVNYFDWKDAQAINSWSEEAAKSILDSMGQKVSQQTALTCADACPFCYKHAVIEGKECGFCEWGKNHGRCDNPSSDYRKARDIAEQRDLRLGDLADMLQPSKFTTLKRWEDRREDDHPEQMYVYLTDRGDKFSLKVLDKNGVDVDAPYVLNLFKKGSIEVCEGLNDSVPGLARKHGYVNVTWD